MIHLQIITPEKVVLQQEVDEVIAPTPDGQIAILPNHINLVTKIAQGELLVKFKSNEQSIAIAGGFLQVHNNDVTVLADFAIRAEEIEIEKALAAQKRAEDVLKKTKESVSERDFALAEAEIQRSILQLNIATKRKRRTKI